MRRSNALNRGLLMVTAWLWLPIVSTASSFDEADVVTEQCLAEGKILEKVRTLTGVTRPELFRIECNGTERLVVFKHLDKTTRGVQRFADGSWEVNFSDCFRYERAAYLLDRELGMEMVPVAVIRNVKRQEGAVLEWIDHASHVRDSPHQPTGPQRAELARQKGIMRLFDALIYNVDRNPSNYLVDDRDWRLYLIDHSRAFRAVGNLPDGFEETTIRLPRKLYEELEKLEETALLELMDGLISRGQIEKMLERRDLILRKIEKDREEFGDDLIFSD